MRADIPEPLQALKTERARLETLLTSDSAWQALRRLGPADRPGANDAAASERRRLEIELGGNRLYLAWRKLDEAIQLLSPEAVAPIALVAVEVAPTAATPRDPTVTSHPTAAPPSGRELTRIRSIDDDLAGRLAGEGLHTLADVAALTAKDVRRIRKALGLERRISQENWIEQAAMLLRQPAPRPVTPSHTAADTEERTTAASGTGRRAPELHASARDVPEPQATGVAADPAAGAAGNAPSLSEALAAAVAHTRAGPAPATLPEPAATAPAPVTEAPATATSLPAAMQPEAPRRHDSLTARLFERAPMGGASGTLLATIHAAEQVRLGRLTDALDAVASRYAPSRPASEPPVPEPPARPASVPAAADKSPAPPLQAIAATAAARAPVPRPAASVAADTQRAGAGAAHTLEKANAADLAHPVMAVLEEEAEVTIIARAAAPAGSKPPVAAGPILPLDSELQGGEDDDPRARATYRGTIEEASVEIVQVKRPPGRSPR